MTVLFRLKMSLGRGLLKNMTVYFLHLFALVRLVAKISSCSDKLSLIELVSYAVKRPGNRTP